MRSKADSPRSLDLSQTMLEDRDRYRLLPGQPLPSACCRCSRPVRFDALPADGLAVCEGCRLQLLLTATPEGRKSVDRAIGVLLQPRYLSVEFQSFDPYTPHLGQVRDAVVGWAKSAARNNAAGSVYLYSEAGPHGPGNGNGKTMLMTAAFKYVARRRVTFYWPDEASERGGWHPGQLNLGTFVLDLKRDAVDRYARSYISHEPVDLRLFDGLLFAHAIQGISVDELVVGHLGRVPVLFLDDVGRGVVPGRMAALLYEDLLNERANRSLPTMVTANYSPEHLADILGTRAVSRILRNDCKVIEVRAPDFATVRLRAQP